MIIIAKIIEEIVLGIDHNPEIKMMYGTKTEIRGRLKMKSVDKYPLVAMRLPLNERNEKGLTDYRLNLVIAAYSTVDRLAENRYNEVISPVIRPIYDKLLTAIPASGKFHQLGPLRFNRVDRLYYSDEKKEQQNVFTDVVDAIEIIDLELKILNNC